MHIIFLDCYKEYYQPFFLNCMIQRCCTRTFLVWLKSDLASICRWRLPNSSQRSEGTACCWTWAVWPGLPGWRPSRVGPGFGRTGPVTLTGCLRPTGVSGPQTGTPSWPPPCQTWPGGPYPTTTTARSRSGSQSCQTAPDEDCNLATNLLQPPTCIILFHWGKSMYCSVLLKWKNFNKIRASYLQPSSLQDSSFWRKEGAKQAALILMKNSHFNRTLL